MADALSTFTDFVIKPSAPFAAGVILFGAVWGFFKGVESVLNEDTKLEIAVWLLGVRVDQRVEPWPQTLLRMFDQVLGPELSFKPFYRSAIATFLFIMISLVLAYSIHPESSLLTHIPWSQPDVIPRILFGGIFGCVIPNYYALWKTRSMLHRLERRKFRHVWRVLIVDFCYTVGFAILAAASVRAVWSYYYPEEIYPDNPAVWEPKHFRLVEETLGDGITHPFLLVRALTESGTAVLWFYPTFFTSIWLWLYAGSGFLLKGARRFDSVFQWFNSKADIEKHPLSSIGLVAGALVAVIYWAAAIVSRIVHHS